jgi:hypothetical protein
MNWPELAEFAVKVPEDRAEEPIAVLWETPDGLPPVRLWLTGARTEDGEPVLLVKQEGV